MVLTRPVLPVAVLALLAAGGALVAVRRRRPSATSPAPPPPPTPWAPEPSTTPAGTAVGHTFTCACGHELRMQGKGRHTVYWEPEAAVSDPLLDPHCTACGRDLPREHAERG